MRLNSPLVTSDLALRSLDASHAGGAYLAWMNDPEVLAFTESRFARHDSAGLAAFIAAMNESPTNLLLGLFDRQDDAHIGNIKLGPIEPEHKRAWLGILIGDRARWGRGLAAQAIDALARHGLEHLGLRRVLAGIYADNTASLRAFAKAGFIEIGRIPSHSRSGECWVDDIIVARGARER